MKSLPMYHSPSFVKYPRSPLPPQPSIRGNIPNENKAFKQILQNSCSENVKKATCVERSRSFIFIPSLSINLLNQRKIVLARNIRYVSDTSLHVYHLDRHEVLFHYEIFHFNTFFQHISAPSACSVCRTFVETSFVASYSIDTLNVIYRLHTLIVLVCLLQIYVHSSPYTPLMTRNALNK